AGGPLDVEGPPLIVGRREAGVFRDDVPPGRLGWNLHASADLSRELSPAASRSRKKSINSDDEVSISRRRAWMRWLRTLNIHAAGTATTRPSAVVTSASAIPWEIAAKPAPPPPAAAMSRKAWTMPITVPKRPMKG